MPPVVIPFDPALQIPAGGQIDYSLSTDDLLSLDLPGASLQAAGFALVAVVYGWYAWHLLRTGLLRTGRYWGSMAIVLFLMLEMV